MAPLQSQIFELCELNQFSLFQHRLIESAAEIAGIAVFELPDCPLKDDRLQREPVDQIGRGHDGDRLPGKRMDIELHGSPVQHH